MNNILKIASEYNGSKKLEKKFRVSEDKEMNAPISQRKGFKIGFI